jgi:hypothetical protein
LADIQAGKYGAAQVFDVQRYPSLPTAGAEFTVSDFDLPVDYSNQSLSRLTMSPGQYVQFVQVSASPCSYAIDLFDSHGSKISRIESGGSIYALDNQGFLHVSDPGDYGTFITNNMGYTLGSSLTYVPSLGLVTCAQAAAYAANTVPFSHPTTIPTLSEWGMIILCVLLAGIGLLRARSHARHRGTVLSVKA